MDSNNQQLYEKQAVKNVKRLIAYTAKKGIPISSKTLKTLTIADEKLKNDAWTAEFAVEFWKAFGSISKAIKPATVDGVRAICFEPTPQGYHRILGNIFGRSTAQRASNLYTIITLFIMLVLLVFQVYWVVGNTLELKLTELLDSEKNLTSELYRNMQDYSELELLYKTKEIEAMDIQSVQRDYNYIFYSTPEWEREKLQIDLEIKRLDGELESIRTQLERNRIVLLYWSGPWKQVLIPEDETDIVVSESDIDDLTSRRESYNNQIAEKEREIKNDPDALKELTAKETERDLIATKVDELKDKQETNEEAFTNTDKESLAIYESEFDKVAQELANPEEYKKQIVSQRNITLQELIDQYNSLSRQIERVKVKEESQRARLGAGFVLVILESYILPVLYALLGASAYVLRTMAQEIEEGKFSAESNRSYILRMALGTLAGLMVGWFVFLLPRQTFLASISPLAIAFLVGYNIEILFSWMDAFIKKFSKSNQSGAGLQENVNDSPV